MSMPGLLPRVLTRFGNRRSASRRTGSTSIEQRKADHISINLEHDVQSPASTGLEQYRLVHSCLPEMDHTDVDPGRAFLGKWLAAPILISSMTGGVLRGGEINHRLAVAAQELGCAMGVGSQRAALENPELAKSFRVRDVAPDILLLANLGAVQLNNGYGIDECRRAVDMIEADALILHLNPVQEALQPDGNRNFGGLLARIASVCRALDVPVVVKEIGFGISSTDARRLANAGVAAIDVAGAGGTSWSAVERHRAANAHDRRLGQTFTEWGIPTATTLQMAREGAPQTPIVASGGLKSGLDAAKVLALGA
ncbi:MAG: type 2 isopentenyl-diphosphate Delta-isomerase, partial [Thermomicrobiales bacterium]